MRTKEITQITPFAYQIDWDGPSFVIVSEVTEDGYLTVHRLNSYNEPKVSEMNVMQVPKQQFYGSLDRIFWTEQELEEAKDERNKRFAFVIVHSEIGKRLKRASAELNSAHNQEDAINDLLAAHYRDLLKAERYSQLLSRLIWWIDVYENEISDKGDHKDDRRHAVRDELVDLYDMLRFNRNR